MSMAHMRGTEKPARTLPDIVKATVQRLPHGVAAKVKRGGGWVTVSWKELYEQARDQAAGLVYLGIEPGERVAVIGNTSLEWVIAELAVQMAGATAVPIYQSNLPHEVEHCVSDSGAVMAFAENEGQLEKFKEIRDRVPALRGVILMRGSGDGEWVLDTGELAAKGKSLLANEKGVVEERMSRIDPEQAACFLYTSGTTGLPKGVVLTHATWAFEADALEKLGIVFDDDEQLIFLPLAHSFAQVLKTAWLKLGHAMAFAESVDRLVDNASEVRPTLMAAVPRVFEKAFNKVVAGGLESPGIKGQLFSWAMEMFDEYADARTKGESYGGLSFTLANKLVFSKVGEKLSERFGGRIRFFVSGGAPLSPRIAYFFDLVGLKILEGYGLTETAAATCVNRPDKNKLGTVGPPVPGMELRIADDGEILIRGGGVMKCYHDKPEDTREVLDEDGWFHSGDIGEIDHDGYLKITDRKKDIIVTAGGKNVAPQNIENQLKTHPLISQVVVHGDKRKFLSALLTLDAENLTKWGAEHGLNGAYEDIVKHPKVHAEIQEAIDRLNERLASYETIKKFAILPTEFSQETGELTPTIKVKRRVVEKRHSEILEGFYQ